ncbi:H-type lectin domain-containing protein [Neogemmobacter tilapiae]|uniref:H-type lectin domain-containing protein n=1 Tax=Neogemmobacter tilapiae TaxID=875041 RepID=A0A918WHM4_9RHOB|nr:H-type lectin domain-containing protein [Gemmobacter tilapiae]GHC47323.1 hypothetical protein GCM10007315_06370 [Gemmobacter tilapiae]
MVKRITRGVIGIQQGKLMLFSDFADGGEMWTGQGPREVRREVKFKEPFLEPPAVLTGLSMWDMDNRQNGRMDLGVDEVTSTGFTIIFRTWADTRIARVRADWTAIGAIKDEDVWEIE